MDLYYPGAVWRGPTPNHGGPDTEARGLVVHIAEGSFEGTIAWQRNPVAEVSSEFVIAADGRVAQMMPANVTAWTQRVGNGHWDAVEFEGRTPNPLTAAQIDACGRLYAWGHTVRGWPLQLATSPAGTGLGHHSMGAESGVDWGHPDCPGPAIKAQKPAILAAAIAIVNGDTTMSLPVGFDANFAALIWRTEAILNNRPVVADGPTAGEVNQLAVAVAAAAGTPITDAQLAELTAAAKAGAEAGVVTELAGATVTAVIHPAAAP